MQRLKKNLSQDELAAKCELNRTFISMLERGVKQPTLSTLFVLSKHLGLSAHEFVFMIETKNRRARWFKNSGSTSD